MVLLTRLLLKWENMLRVRLAGSRGREGSDVFRFLDGTVAGWLLEKHSSVVYVSGAYNNSKNCKNVSIIQFYTPIKYGHLGTEPGNDRQVSTSKYGKGLCKVKK